MGNLSKEAGQCGCGEVEWEQPFVATGVAWTGHLGSRSLPNSALSPPGLALRVPMWTPALCSQRPNQGTRETAYGTSEVPSCHMNTSYMAQTSHLYLF